ncbi:MAG: Omp28-related outer membrane protein [Rikenellaceae bacterium]
MKKYSLALLCALISVFCISCEESSDNGLKINVSSTSVAVGESVTFTVTLDGEDVTANSQIVNITNGITDHSGYTFSSTTAGDFTFNATYNSATTDNQVTVTVSDSDDPSGGGSDEPLEIGEFLRRSVIFKATATWCTYCPTMSSVIDAVEEDMPDQIVEIALQSNDVLATTASYYYLSYFSISSLPTVVIDANTKYKTTTASVSQIKSYIASATADNPTTSGLKIDTDIDENDKVTVSVETTITEQNKYSIVVALLVDGYSETQTGSSDPNYTQDNVLYATLQETSGGDYLGELKAGAVFTKTYTYNFTGMSSLPEGTSVKIAAFILNSYNDSSLYYINNAVVCPLGESVDYTFVD